MNKPNPYVVGAGALATLDPLTILEAFLRHTAEPAARFVIRVARGRPLGGTSPAFAFTLS